MPISVFGAVSQESDSYISFKIQYQYGGKAISNTEFSLYEVAAISENGEYVPNGAFGDYSVRWTFSDDSEKKQLAETLSAYAARDHIQPFCTGKTDSNGNLTVLIKKSALYLAVGAPYESGENLYTAEPILLSAESAVGSSSSAASPKSGRDGGESKRIERSVVKVWKDADGSHPAQVQVQLLRNGAVYDTVTLNEANNWRYSWKNLKAGDVWQMTEKDVPEGYTVSVDLESTTFIVTNTSDDIPVDPVVPDDPGDPGDPADSGDPNHPTLIDSPGNVGTGSGDTDRQSATNISADASNNEKLPQTGIYWWPIPLLAFAGMIFFLIGWVRYREN